MKAAQMTRYLVLQLRGVMQAWGTHTFEDFRPSSNFPTRSAVVGLLGACIGIERDDIDSREQLNSSINMDVVSVNPQRQRKIQDFHTVLDARKVDGKPRKDAIISKREYLCDSSFLVFVSENQGSEYSLEFIAEHLNQPVFTPFLGRKSCPITAPLYCTNVSAGSITDAVREVTSEACIVYSENRIPDSTEFQIRDIPAKDPVRKFEKRSVHILSMEATDVLQ